MPVRFEKTTEYDRSYKWLDSYKSRDFKPSLDQVLPRAGVPTLDAGVVFDPPIQRRRKPTEAVHSSQMFDDAPAAKDDYVLIGDQSKFAPSVKYTLPKKDRQPVKSHAEQPVENGHSYSSGPRSPPDAPRPVLEDDSYKRKPSNYIPRPTKPSIKAKNHVFPKKSASEPKKLASEPPRPVSVPAIVTKPPAPIPAPSAQEAAPKPATKPGQYREKRTGQMNEFVQTDLSKGVADSGQEAPNDYAMKYRAGVAPPRPRGPKRLSEYQLQFKWKKGLTPSPLLAAEQIIYNSNPHLAPYSNPAVMPKTTEYKAAFKEYAYRPVPVEKSEATPAKKAKMQRSKSMEALTPDRRRAAGVHSGHRSTEDKRLLQESQNPTRVFFPHGKTKYAHSEYASNFKAPTAFSYEEGAWRGADPPHIHPRRNPIPVDVEDGGDARVGEKVSLPSSWYQEVVELRNKAAEYKQRARGTHFSRQHLAQLYARQSDLWDTVSNSSTLSALSLESATPRPKKTGKKQFKPKDDSPRESVASTVTTTSTSASSVKEKSAPKKQSKKAWADEQSSTRSEKSTMTGSASPESASTVVAEDGSEEGRVPTPKFRKDLDAEYKWRHHLDRTTPAVGGALLTSPSQKKSKGTRSEPALQDKHGKSTAQVRCTCKSDDESDSDRAKSPKHYPIYSYPMPRPSQYRYSERIQPVRTHTEQPVFNFLPEKKPPYIQTSARPMFGTTARPVMVPQVAARLLDPYGQYGVEEKIVDEPWEDGYVNPVYMGEGEIMQPSAQAIITPTDTQYAMVPRYVPRSLPSSPEPRRVDKENREPRREGHKTMKSHHKKVSASWAGPVQTYGLPTRDSHVLMDEEASTDRTLHTKYHQSPPNKPKENRPREFDLMPTLKETLRELRDTNSVPEDDVLSISARSVASSCSLASEVLERARHRRDDFWGKSSKKQTRS